MLANDYNYIQRLRVASYRIVQVLLGGVLLIAAAAKAYALIGESPIYSPLFDSPRLQWGLAEVEFLLGLWLLLGWSPGIAGMAATAFYAIMACVSLRLALQQQISCGCFGRIIINPWITFAVDVTAVVLLIALGPFRPTLSFHRERTRAALKMLAGVLFFILAAIVLLEALFGNFVDLLANTTDVALTVDPAAANVGPVPGGGEHTVQVRLHNHTDQPISVVGGTSTCSCVATEDLPITLSGGSSQAIAIKLRFPRAPGHFRESYTLFASDNTTLSFVRGEVFGELVDGHEH